MLIVTEFLTALKTIVHEDQIGILENTSHPLGNSGDVKVFPRTEEEISAILEYANKNSLTISVIGGGTKRGFGGQMETANILLSLSQYKGIVEHTSGNMTLTVKSGTSFKELQTYLAAYKQRIPLDPLWPENATIGGIIAANESGPKRLGYGSARDVVIGLRMVYPDGKVIRAGGKVVKNVAGYDMNKLFIGSMGTLGIISEVTIKLRPMAKFESLILVSFSQGGIEEMRQFAVKVLDSALEPICVELLNTNMSEVFGQKRPTIVLAFEDVESSVRYQEECIKEILSPNGDMTILQGEKAIAFWEVFYKTRPSGANESSGPEIHASVKIGVVNLDVFQVMKESESIGDRYNVSIKAHGGLGHGLCHLHISGARDDVVSAIKLLKEKAEELSGYAVVTHLPFHLRTSINVWGENPSIHFLLEGIKAKIDPNNILNPNRFVGGI